MGTPSLHPASFDRFYDMRPYPLGIVSVFVVKDISCATSIFDISNDVSTENGDRHVRHETFLRMRPRRLGRSARLARPFRGALGRASRHGRQHDARGAHAGAG